MAHWYNHEHVNVSLTAFSNKTVSSRAWSYTLFLFLWCASFSESDSSSSLSSALWSSSSSSSSSKSSESLLLMPSLEVSEEEPESLSLLLELSTAFFLGFYQEKECSINGLGLICYIIFLLCIIFKTKPVRLWSKVFCNPWTQATLSAENWPERRLHKIMKIKNWSQVSAIFLTTHTDRTVGITTFQSNRTNLGLENWPGIQV